MLICAKVHACYCLIFVFKILHTFSVGDLLGLQAGQSSTCALFFHSHAFIMCTECGFQNCLAEKCLDARKRSFEGSICCSKFSLCFSALILPSQMYKQLWPRALTQPPTMKDPGCLDGLFRLWSGAYGISFFQNYGLLIYMITHFQYVMVHPRCHRVQRSGHCFLHWAVHTIRCWTIFHTVPLSLIYLYELCSDWLPCNVPKHSL